MTFNIKNSRDPGEWDRWEDRRDLVASVIRLHAPAAAGLQEVFREQLDDLDAALEDYRWCGAGRDDGQRNGEYVPILYRADCLELTESGNFWLSEHPDAPGTIGWDAHCPRLVTWARFSPQNPDPAFVLFNTHFDHAGSKARRESAHLLLRRIGQIAPDEPVVVMGDLNCRETDEPYGILTSAFPPLCDARYAARYAHHGPSWTWANFNSSEGQPGDNIDHIFVTKGLRVHQHAAIADHWDGRRPSDHLPLLAEILP